MIRFFFLLFILYIAGYGFIRTNYAQVWEKDQQTYVIFPKEPKLLYYAYRPMTYLDCTITGMKFHIGPHSQ